MALRGSRGSEWVYDELLCFVGSPLFQIPVATFLESNCLIFHPSVEDCRQYKEIHEAYRELVTALLDAFRQDTKLTHEQIIHAMTEMSEKEDLREIFQELFKQILAVENHEVFTRIMTEKNIELQQQALMLLLHRLGHTPDSLQGECSPGSDGTRTDEIASSISAMSLVISESSTRALEMDMLYKASNEPIAMPTVSPSVVAMSKTDLKVLEAEKKKEQQRLTEAVRRMALAQGEEADEQCQMEAKTISRQTVPPPQAPGPKEHDTATSQTVAAPSDDLKKRQEFLNQQREKLIAMKQKEREKQLDTYERSQPQARPQSSRAARMVVMAKALPPDGQAGSEEEEKKLAMRRAIANRLKAEMLGK